MTEEEFEAVYERTARPLRSYLVRAGGDVALADDVLQETYYRFLTMDPAQRGAAPERPLLYRMATHALYDHFRRLRREQRVSLAASRPSVTTPSELPQDLARVFHELTPRERSLVWLAYAEGFTHAEIAEVLDVGPRSVRVLLFRAKSALVRRLRAHGLAPEVKR